MRNRQLLIEGRRTREWAARTVIEFHRPLPVLLPLVPLTDVDTPVKVPARDEWRWGLFVFCVIEDAPPPVLLVERAVSKARLTSAYPARGALALPTLPCMCPRLET
jgi:hypothetical protein